MILRILAIVLLALAAAGCREEPQPVEPTEPEVEITEENLDAELDKMAEQIEADIAAEE